MDITMLNTFDLVGVFYASWCTQHNYTVLTLVHCVGGETHIPPSFEAWLI